MDHQFKRLLNLVRRTGDRLVVTDPNGEDTYVLMGLEAYENLLKTDTLSPWERDGVRDDDFLDDYYDEDSDDEEFEDKPKWEIPDELLNDITVGASGRSPITDSSAIEHSPVSDIPSINLNEPSKKAIWDVMPPAGDKSETWNPEKFDEEEKKVVEEKFEKPEFPPSTDKKDDEDLGEEQFYLEPVE